jgi:hypothetical protein
MIAVFYDRKNKREVNSKQLMSINLVQSLATGDSDDKMIATGRRYAYDSHGNFETPRTHKEFDQLASDDEFFRNAGCPAWESLKEEKTPIVLYLKDQVIGEIGYKSEKCGEHQNWDLYTTLNDLVFLRLEDETGAI